MNLEELLAGVAELGQKYKAANADKIITTGELKSIFITLVDTAFGTFGLDDKVVVDNRPDETPDEPNG